MCAQFFVVNRHVAKALFVTAVAAITLFSQINKALAAPTDLIDISTSAGVRWEFQPEGGDWKPINVPAGGWRAQGYSCNAGNYRTQIPIPQSAAGQDIQLRFDAINFGADILVGQAPDNLTKVASHIDGWVPVTADITSLAVPGKPLFVEVDVKGRGKFMVNGKYTVPEGATWDTHLEDGILRGVHLAIQPLVHIDDAVVVTEISPDTVKGSVTITNSSSAPETVHLKSVVIDGRSGKATKVCWPEIGAELGAGETRTVDLPPITWTLGSTSYWWPNVPYRPGYRARLYSLSIEESGSGDARHSFSRQFGFRQFVAVGNHFYLNGVRCNLRGDNLQEANFDTDAYGIRPGFGPPSPGNGGWPEAVDNLEHLNFNVMRIHQIPATDYMLDVCDEKGFMLVEESPLRGSEGGEDYQDGKENMLNMDRELVKRDRNHPSVIIWSAANEWSEPIADATQAILAIDSSRPIYADGAVAAAPAIDTGHYISGFNVLPKAGMAPRTDRPYGETEDIWPGDNTLRGFAWMATGIRLRRLDGDSDLRNYTLNNAWPNFVPGESPDNELLEIKLKGEPDAKILPSITDPWHNSHILLMQQCYNPVAACDVDFDAMNANSNTNGDWPVQSPAITSGSKVTRSIAVFNDEFSGDKVDFAWQATLGAIDGPIIGSGRETLTIPLGDYVKTPVTFDAPKANGLRVFLQLTTTKDGQVRFRETQISFITGVTKSNELQSGNYKIRNEMSGLYLGWSAVGGALVQQPFVGPAEEWNLAYAKDNSITLTNKVDGLAIVVLGTATDNGTAIVAAPMEPIGSGQWTLQQPTAGDYVIVNKASGRVMDDYHQSHDDNAPVVLYDANGGANQLWSFEPVMK